MSVSYPFQENALLQGTLPGAHRIAIKKQSSSKIHTERDHEELRLTVEQIKNQ